MRSPILTDYYDPLFAKERFVPAPCGERFGQAGECWTLSPEVGDGAYWVYARGELFDVKIHDFSFHEDHDLDIVVPEGIRIAYYDSISGEEPDSRALSAGSVQTIVGEKQRYRAHIRKNVPVRSVGIEIFPAYYEDFLTSHYPGESFDLSAAFQSVDRAADFPAMAKLLHEIERYRGGGLAASLFYEAKVAEAVALVVERHGFDAQNAPLSGFSKLSKEDLAGVDAAVRLIEERYAETLPLGVLAREACMSPSKFKTCFKRRTGRTFTEYLQNRRMEEAARLLSGTELSVGQIAREVGYSSPGRFSELFKKNMGMLPVEYRKSM